MAPIWQAVAELIGCDEEVFSRASGTLLLQATATKPSDIVTVSQHEDLGKKGQQLPLALIGFWYVQCQHQSLNASEQISLQDLYKANSNPTRMTRLSSVHYISMQMLSPYVTDSMLSGHSGTAQQPHALILSAALVMTLAALATTVKADEYKETCLAQWRTITEVSCKLAQHYSRCQLVHATSSSSDAGTEQELCH